MSICAVETLADPAASREAVMLWQSAEGRTVSMTMTLVAQEAELPDASATVMVTGTVPKSPQLKLLGLNV